MWSADPMAGECYIQSNPMSLTEAGLGPLDFVEFKLDSRVYALLNGATMSRINSNIIIKTYSIHSLI